MRGACYVAISTDNEQIATLTLAMTGKYRYYDITKLRCVLLQAESLN
ncbi:MAG: hypothetical protein ACK5IQ_05860 [Bacteroidales bacterium]